MPFVENITARQSASCANSGFNSGPLTWISTTDERRANGVYQTDPGAPKAEAKRILQGVYDKIPFIEMKRSDYNWSVRAPQ